MPSDTDDGLSDRRRAHEDEYFRQRDREVVEKARQRADDEAALRRLAAAVGVSDEAILRELQWLEYTAETVASLNVLPLIAVAWADGSVSEPEHNAIVAAARVSGVEPGSRADQRVAEWLANPPSAVFADETLHVLGAVLQRRPPDEREAAIRDLRASCTTVASASGGIFGFRPISDTEQRVLDRIFYELERKDAPTPRL